MNLQIGLRMVAAGCCLAWTMGGAAQLLPYQNPRLSFAERAQDLCSRLTLEEKASLMCDVSPAIPRLGIKPFNWWSEALHGYANNTDVTVFPEPIGMAASFNPALVYKVFTATSDEARGKYNLFMAEGKADSRFHSLSVWTPNVNIFRDPRWGRGQETYGEDPYLTSVMGVQVVKGLQGPETTKYRKLYACAKHFAVHSGPEYTRHTANLADISPRDLWETYLPAFKAAVEQGHVREVMCAYQRLDDEPCCGNSRLLQQILRNEWGFKHMVVSDCGAISDFYINHHVSSDAVHAASKGTLAGTDVECGSGYAYMKLPEAVRRGLVSEQEVDKHVTRILKGRFELGVMDDPKLVSWTKISPNTVDSKEHRQLALDMALQTMTLLQNKNGVLPLDKAEKIAVVGPNADDAPMLWGNYNGVPSHTTTILEGIRQIGGKTIPYLRGCDLVSRMVLESKLSECAKDGKKGIKASFWNNTTQQGTPVTVTWLREPVNVTTYGQHSFADGVKTEDFSARYETDFTPRQSGEDVIKMQYTGRFDLSVDGKQVAANKTWRTDPVQVSLKVEKGKTYHIVLNYYFVKGWGSNLCFDLGHETPLDYSAVIGKLKDIKTVVFVGGISSKLEGEEMPVDVEGFKGGDRTSIELPEVQRAFLKALKAAGKTVVFVNCSGSAMALTPEVESCDAILQAWYPGEEGGKAVADVLYGNYNPGGKLPVTFYRSTAQLPDYEDYSMKGRTYRYFNDALFPFGYGLSYTTMEIGKAQLSAPAMKTDGTVTLNIPVSNTGKRAGTEVVQVYIKANDDAEGPLKSLRAFQRVSLKAGERKTVAVPLTADAFCLFDPASNTMRTKAGAYTIFYGNSSADKDLKQVDFKIEE